MCDLGGAREGRPIRRYTDYRVCVLTERLVAEIVVFGHAVAAHLLPACKKSVRRRLDARRTHDGRGRTGTRETWTGDARGEDGKKNVEKTVRGERKRNLRERRVCVCSARDTVVYDAIVTGGPRGTGRLAPRLTQCYDVAQRHQNEGQCLYGPRFDEDYYDGRDSHRRDDIILRALATRMGTVQNDEQTADWCFGRRSKRERGVLK